MGGMNHEITSPFISAQLEIPDGEQGSYRATRFDWSGRIASLIYEGLQFSGPWFTKADPYHHDAICGPVNEFDPIGFDATPIDGTFLKIGVGLLRKPSADYQRFVLHEIVDPGQWEVSRGSDQVVFQHRLTSDIGSYRYTKTIRLLADEPVLLLEYSLENTGTRPIESHVFNHNFFVIDRSITGPHTIIEFPFAPVGRWRDAVCPAETRGNRMVFTRNLQLGESVYMAEVSGFDPQQNYRFRIANQSAKAGVEITGSCQPFQVSFWASHLTVCPEAFIRLSVAPKDSFSWSDHYTFYRF